MRKMDALDQSTPAVDDLRDDLEAIGIALDRLIGKARAADNRHRRFDRYLKTLDRMHREVAEMLEGGGSAKVDEAARGVREAWARLAIANSAAAARFG